MVLPVAHTHPILQAGIIGPSLSLHGIIHKVPDPVHIPLAPVPGQGVHQVPVVQDHCDQALTLNFMLDPKCLQKAAVLMGQDDDEDTTAGGEEDAGHSEDEEALSQGIVSLLDISTSDNEDAHKATVHEAVCKSDIQYGNWWDEQIHQGKEGIAQHDKGVNDYTNGRKPCKAPDKIGRPVPYMEECRVFQPLDTIANPLGLCHFYHTKPPYSNVITSPKSAASTRRIKHLLEKAKDLGWPFTIVVLEGGNVTLLGLLQELHSQLTLSHILIFTPEEAKLGQKMRTSCCPICMYIVKNDSAFLNHIVICHYWSSLSCGKCLKFVVSSAQQMKKHILKCPSIKDACEQMDSQCSKWSKPHGSGGSSIKPKQDKKDKEDKCGKKEKDDKPHRSESKSGNKATSQEQVLESLCCHSKCIAESGTEGSHHKSHKKSKKHSKKLQSPIRCCVNRRRSIQFQTRFVTVLTVLLFLIKYTVN